SSYLVEITAIVLAERDPRTREALVDVIIDEAGQKGTGRWSVIAAQQLGVGATTLEAAVSARALSALRHERLATSRIYDGMDLAAPNFENSDEAIGDLES